MKKFYLLLSAVLFAVLTATAQTATVSWGYCNPSSVSGAFTETKTVKGAIYIPAEIAKMYAGAEVSGIRVGMSGTALANTFEFFVTEDLNSTPLLTEKYSTQVVSGFTNISFTSGTYTISDKGFYIGCSCEGSDQGPLGVSGQYDENGCWADLGDGWKNYATDPNYSSNALSIMARIKGTDLPKDFALLEVKRVAQKKNTPFDITGTIMSRSPKMASSFQIGYRIDGGEETVATVDKKVGPGKSVDFAIEHPGLSVGGNHTIDCRIVSVGGEEDPYEANNSASGMVGIVERFPKYRMAVEEGTGTWCGWCPRGIMGFKRMQETYPDNFVGIAIHPAVNSEPWALQAPTYSPLTFTSFPTAYINRNPRMLVTPSFETLQAAYLTTKEELRLGEIDVKSTLIDNNTISATATVTFVTDINDAHYRVAFVITEDNISGYTQANNLYGNNSYKDESGEFYSNGTYAQVDMQHVAHEIFGYRGIEGSVPTTIKTDVPVTFTKELDVTNSRIKDMGNVNVIALLFNTDTGLIENAAEARVGHTSTAISDVADTVAPELSVVGGSIVCGGYGGTLSVYTVDGKQVANSGLQRGIYIVKGNSGKQSFVKRIAL